MGRDPVQRAEILWAAQRILRVLEITDPEHFQRIWGPRRSPLGHHSLGRNVGDYRVACDTWGWIKVRDSGEGWVHLMEVQFVRQPLDVGSVLTFRRDQIFKEVMPEVGRILVLEDMAKI